MKRFFHSGLYKEGLRQSMIVGIIFTSLMMLGAVFTPWSIISGQRDLVSYTGALPPKVAVDGISFNSVLVLSFVLFAPLLALFLFSFLNKRSSSDFYHSLPHKRETLFGSYFAAMLTWIFGALLLCVATSGIIYTVFAKYVIVNWTSVLVMLFNMAAASLLVASVTTMAMSITGTGFTNIIVALLILFLPRLLLLAFTSQIQNVAMIVPSEAFGILGDVTYQIPANLIVSILSIGAGIEKVFTSFASGLYTMILGLLYLAASFLLFKKRKSETAATSAPNRFMQHVFRVAITFTFCLIPCALLITISTAADQYYSGAYIGVATLYGVALVIYFAYELITTRKFKNLAKALPALGVLVLLNVGYIVGVTVSANTILNTQLDEADVSGVRIISQTYSFYEQQSPTYESLVADKITLQDSELNKLVAQTLAKTQEYIKSYGTTQVDTYSFMQVAIERKSGSTLHRYLFPTEEDRTKLTKALAQNQEYRDAIMNLPDKNFSLYFLGDANLSDAYLNEIYASLREEVKTLDFETWYALVNQSKSMYDYSDYAGSVYSVNQMNLNLQVTGSLGVNNYSSTYPITSATPKTLQLLIKYINQDQLQAGVAALERMKTPEDMGEYNLNITSAGFTDDQGNSIDSSMSYYYYADMPDEEKAISAIPDAALTQLLEDCQQQADGQVDVSKPYYYINLYLYGVTGEDYRTDNGYVSYTFFVNASGDLPLFQSSGLTEKY